MKIMWIWPLSLERVKYFQIVVDPRQLKPEKTRAEMGKGRVELIFQDEFEFTVPGKGAFFKEILYLPSNASL